MNGLSINNELVNLEYSLNREFISTNRLGGYMCSTPVCCNTHRYSGLMTYVQGEADRNPRILLSSLDETLNINGLSFNLAIHQYNDVITPKGHKYITHFSHTPTPTFIYRIGDVEIKKELLWLRCRNHLLVRYTLETSEMPIELSLRPLLAFREISSLSVANDGVNTDFRYIEKGVGVQMYNNYPYLFMQCNGDDAIFESFPDWYYDMTYVKDLNLKEDLFTPGVFKTTLTQQKSVVLSFSTTEIPTKYLEALFQEEIKRHPARNSFIESVTHSVSQFVMYKKDGNELITSYPYVGETSYGDILKSLATICYATSNATMGLEILDNTINKLRLISYNIQRDNDSLLHSWLWIFNTIEDMEEFYSREFLWNRYKNDMSSILSGCSNANVEDNGFIMHDNGLLWCDNVDTLGRYGYLSDVCALWYNAIYYSLSLANEFGDYIFLSQWEGFEKRIKESFNELFFSPQNSSIADYINTNTNHSVRARVLTALYVHNSPLEECYRGDILQKMAYHLQSLNGVRTLSPDDINYNVTDNPLPWQGGVSVFATYIYVKALKRIDPLEGTRAADKALEPFINEYNRLKLTNISDYYNDGPSLRACGAISSLVGAASIVAIWRLSSLAEGSDNDK